MIKIIHLLTLSFFCFAVLSVKAAPPTMDDGLFQRFLHVKILPLARERGIDDKTLQSAFKGLTTPDPRVMSLDKRQPESKETLSTYVDKRIPPRIHTARKKRKKHRLLLEEAQAKYGVPKEFILSLWGLESNFGTCIGGFDIIRSLATLAFEGRREEFFTNELIEALKVLQESRFNVKAFKGSWAGSMGQCQFMPSAFNLHAVDTGNKGVKDIWKNKKDVFNSIANYLINSGWKKNQPWGVEVKIPQSFNTKSVTIHMNKSMHYWLRQGIRPKDKKKKLANLPGALIISDQKDRAFIVYNNFKVILKWNRSINFALTVCLFADQIAEK